MKLIDPPASARVEDRDVGVARRVRSGSTDRRRKRESVSLRIARLSDLADCEFRFQIITSEYHQGSRRLALLPGNTAKNASLVQELPTARRSWRCQVATPSRSIFVGEVAAHVVPLVRDYKMLNRRCWASVASV